MLMSYGFDEKLRLLCLFCVAFMACLHLGRFQDG